MTNEYEIIQLCLKANLECLNMCKETERKDKNLILLTVINELKNMCETMIPIFEKRIENDLIN
tara:strand:+ start:706 stop:894 length:189 start_codon:yes stop_codon:yes gene_type:complete